MECASKIASPDPLQSARDFLTNHPLGPGTRLGPYEIQSALGAGGMGEVYRANDSALGRQVAIKVLPDALATDPERLARFEREAKTLASLNHPNITQIYGLERSELTPALVMELVEGETLADRIARGPIPVDEALPIAKQIAEALEAAHEQGIIHRDLKPGNIKVRSDGTVKVLDFGLAKLTESASPATSGASLSPTITSPAMMTGVGVLLGTAAYMSPEQAKGKPADKRSDIWAFGCVLFEMLTGSRAFPGDDVSDTIAAILRANPDWTTFPRAVPACVRHLLERCLEKDSRLRLRDMGEARIALDQPRIDEYTDASAARHVRRGTIAIAALAVIGAFAVGFLIPPITRPAATQVPASPVIFSLFAPEHTIFSPNGVSRFSVAADGRTIALVADAGGHTSIWLQAFDSLTPRQLTGTQGAQGSPFWSPDSRSLAFIADGNLKRIDVGGGALSTICNLPANTRIRLAVLSNDRGTWNSDDVIIFPAGNALYRVSGKGGDAQLLFASPDARETYEAPSFLDDGKHFVFAIGGPTARRGIWIGSLDGTAPTQIIPQSLHPTWSPPYLLFIRNGLMAQRLDPRSNTLVGDPQAVGLAGVDTATILSTTSNFSASRTGVLVYSAGLPLERSLEWVDRRGRSLGKVGEPATWGNFDLSPDGTRLVAGLNRPTTGLA